MNNDDKWTTECPLCGSEGFSNVDAYGDPQPFWICGYCGHRFEMTSADSNAILNRAFPSPGSIEEFLNTLERGLHTGTNDFDG
jgi:hypothetical protein